MTITVTRYVPIPDALLAPCAAPTARTSIVTNADLLDAYLADAAALETCGAQVRGIQNVMRAKP